MKDGRVLGYVVDHTQPFRAGGGFFGNPRTSNSTGQGYSSIELLNLEIESLDPFQEGEETAMRTAYQEMVP